MPEPSDFASLQGKLLLVWLHEQPSRFPGGIAIEYAELRSIAGRVFLSGRGPAAHGVDWNVPYLVSWESVAFLLTFATREEFFSTMGGGTAGLLSRIASTVRGRSE
jgi:hypothetical protein